MKKLILTVACIAVVQGLWADVEAGKAYRLVPATDKGKAVFVENSAFDNGKKVVLWTQTPAPSQQWYAERQGEKWVLRNVYTGKYLTIASTVAQQSDKATATSAQWTLEPIDASTNTYRVAQTIGTQLRYLGAAKQVMAPNWHWALRKRVTMLHSNRGPLLKKLLLPPLPTLCAMRWASAISLRSFKP